MKPSNPMDHATFDLAQEMRRAGSGCPICSLVKKGASSYLDAISYEKVNDLDLRRELRQSLGYCAAHGQEWLRLQDTLGTAMIYRDVLSTALEALEAHVPPDSPDNLADGEWDNASNQEQDGLMGRLRGFLGNGQPVAELGQAVASEIEPTEPCPVCQYIRNREKELVEAFAGAPARQDFFEAYRQHETGLCLPHLRQVLVRVSRPILVRALVRAQEAKLEATLADLSEVIRKYDYRNRDEAHGVEFKVPARSVEQAGGSLPTQLNLPRGEGNR